MKTIRKFLFAIVLTCFVVQVDWAQTNTYRGHIVDVLKHRVYDGEVLVNNGLISSVRECVLPSGVAYPYILPGFIDSHMHIESSMILPQEYAKAAVCHGTIGSLPDPHEIGNVLGIEGVLYMIEQSKRVPFNFSFAAPSCVPCYGGEVETSGAQIDSKDVEKLLSMKEVGHLSEVMNYVGVLGGDPEMHAKIKAAHKAGKPIDGHAPGLLEETRLQYAQTGITTDHECSTLEEGRQCIKSGMKLIIREGSAARDFQALSPLIDQSPEYVMFCTDDYNPNDLMKGHINLIVRRALADGYDFWNVMQAAIVNPQLHYKLCWGLLQKGDPANFIMTDSITPNFQVLKTVLRGRVVYDHVLGASLPISGNAQEKDRMPNFFMAQPITAADIRMEKQPGDTCHIIVATDGSLLTGHDIRPYDGEQDQKIVVLNRYQEGAKPVIALISGFNVQNGAMAASVSHDCHNIVAIGSNDESIVRAVNRVIEMKGGMVAIAGDEMVDLALPIAGIMSPLNIETVAEKNMSLHEMVRKAGCTMKAPFITMSFMSLPVIPELKITDKFLWDSHNMKPMIDK